MTEDNNWDEHMQKIGAAEAKVAEALVELELLHRAMAIDPWIRELPLDPVTVAQMYLCRALAVRRMEMLGSLGVDEVDKASAEAGISVRMAMDREATEISRLMREHRAVAN